MPWPGPVGGAFAPSSRSAAPRSGYGASCAASATPRSMPIRWAHPSQCCKTHALRRLALPRITVSFAATCTPWAAHWPPVPKLTHLIGEQANAQGEDIKRLMGITSARLRIKTRLQGWEIVPAGTHEARKAAEAAARGVGVQTGDSPAPWSSGNNCTLPAPGVSTDQIMREQWGLSPFSIDRLRVGASIRADGFTLWLENGQMQSSQSLPSEPDWQLEGLASRTGPAR